jgi:hypothetical protein
MRLLLVLVFILLLFPGYAQLPENQFLYGNLGFSLGNFWGGTAGINFAVSEKYSLQLEYSGTSRTSKSVPSDFAIGLVDVFSLGTTTPKDRIKSLRFVAGKVKTINQFGTVRINFKAGMSFLTITEPYRWEKISSVFVTSNYTWVYKTIHQAGVVLKPEFEFLFANFAGVTISPYCELTGNYSAFGIGFNMLLGKVR